MRVVSQLLLILVRHGETEANRAGILQGHCDYPLTTLGKEQARRAGAALAGVSFARVFSSDLKRAYDTACLISDSTGGSLALSEIHQEGLVKEKAFGLMERLPRGTDLQEAKVIVAERDGISVDEVESKYPPAETQEQMKVRQDAFVRNLTRQNLPPDSKVLVVSHGAYIKAFVSNMCSIPIDEVERIKNCSVTGIHIGMALDGAYECSLVEGGLNCHAHQVTGTSAAEELEFEGGDKDELAWLRM
jgi:broad specificity phosphatase PhoE